MDSEILLYDLATGRNLALLDGDWITTMRTGAVAANSIILFGKRDFKTISFTGLGNTARACLKILLSNYAGQDLTIKLKKYKTQHELFAKEFKGFAQLRFEFCDSYQDVIKDSDVIVSAVTYFDEDICPDNACFKEGCLVVPIHTRGFTNCDLFFDKVFADDVNHVKGFKYFSKFKKFAEVSDVINNLKPGRENSKERILAYNIGISLHDIYFAGKIYELVKNDERVLDVSLKAPDKKFWV